MSNKDNHKYRVCNLAVTCDQSDKCKHAQPHGKMTKSVRQDTEGHCAVRPRYCPYPVHSQCVMEDWHAHTGDR